MAEYIDRAALMSHIESQAREWGEEYDAQQILGDIEDFPTADVAEVKHGEWIWSMDFPIMQAMIRCSLCNEPSITMSKFCPNCGAKMDGGEE